MPNLITNVVTTEATVPEVAMTAPIHQQWADKDLLAAEHLLDSGYPLTELVLQAARLHGPTLVSPLLLDHPAQARAAAGYDKAAFTFDFDARQATCPQQLTSSSWPSYTPHNTEAIMVSRATTACGPCPLRELCTRGKRHHITIRSHELHEALTTAHAEQNTNQCKARYATRTGVEATMRQSTHTTGIRHARYPGQPKTAPEHNLAATAINVIRPDAYWTARPLDRTRSSHLTRLDLTTAA
jgi:hypothetical protein